MSACTSHARECSGRNVPVNSSTAIGSIAATSPSRSATASACDLLLGLLEPRGERRHLAPELRAGLDRLGHLPGHLDPRADDVALGPVERERGLVRDEVGQRPGAVPAAGELGHGGRLGDDDPGALGVPAESRRLQRRRRPPGQGRRGCRPPPPARPGSVVARPDGGASRPPGPRSRPCRGRRRAAGRRAPHRAAGSTVAGRSPTPVQRVLDEPPLRLARRIDQHDRRDVRTHQQCGHAPTSPREADPTPGRGAGRPDPGRSVGSATSARVRPPRFRPHRG